MWHSLDIAFLQNKFPMSTWKKKKWIKKIRLLHEALMQGETTAHPLPQGQSEGVSGWNGRWRWERHIQSLNTHSSNDWKGHTAFLSSTAVSQPTRYIKFIWRALKKNPSRLGDTWPHLWGQGWFQNDPGDSSVQLGSQLLWGSAPHGWQSSPNGSHNQDFFLVKHHLASCPTRV